MLQCIKRVFNNSYDQGTDLISILSKEHFILSKPLILFIKQMLQNVLLHTDHTGML